MRFRISFRVQGSRRLLPLSYKYELSSWMYHQFEKADPAFGLD
ncbi:MAG: hypothetical protein AAF587_13245 [Bacteroidota bacterium]